VVDFIGKCRRHQGPACFNVVAFQNGSLLAKSVESIRLKVSSSARSSREKSSFNDASAKWRAGPVSRLSDGFNCSSGMENPGSYIRNHLYHIKYRACITRPLIRCDVFTRKRVQDVPNEFRDCFYPPSRAKA